MREKVFVYVGNTSIEELQKLLDDGWRVKHATPQAGNIVYILETLKEVRLANIPENDQ